MKNSTKLLSVAVCLLMLLSALSVNGFAVGVVGNYPDVYSTDWYYSAVEYCAEERYITGFSDGTFGPLKYISRQDFVLILARIDGVNLKSYNTAEAVNKFSDVNDKNAYYTAALAWGVKNGIVNGYNNGKFGVGDPITREQICVFIFRYLQYKGEGLVVTDKMRNDLRNFKDGGSVSAFAKDAVAWCRYKGVINGTKDGYINPVKNALRCEIAQIVYNSAQSGLFGIWMDI